MLRAFPVLGWLAIASALLSLATARPAAGQTPETPQMPASTAVEVVDPFAPPPPSEEENAQESASDRLYLSDRSLLEGRLQGYLDGAFLLWTSSLGEVQVEPEKIVRFSLERERILYVQPRRGAESRAVTVTVGSDGTLLKREANRREWEPIPYDDIYRMSINPIPTAEWEAYVGVIGTSTSGNTDQIGLGVTGQITRRSLQDILSFSFEFDFLEVEKVVEKRLLLGQAEYRHYFSDFFGVTAQNRSRKDYLSGLIFRNITSTGGTLRFLSEPDLTAALDFGINYTFESRIAEDVQYFGGQAGLSYYQEISNSWIVQGSTTFLVDFGNFDRWTLNGQLEVRKALDGNFSISVRIEDEYANLPGEGFEQNDVRILFTFGYTFE